MDKERAEKAMREAEQKFQSNDIEGAKRKVLRAQKLFPSLPGLPQMLAAFNVHIAAASKDAKGRTKWYAVLDVDPSDDIKTIKKQYKKLCLLIHPDKNLSSAAEGAFKLVVQAWEAISGNASSSKKASKGTSGSPSDSGAGDQHSSTSGARSSSRPSSAQSDPKTTGSSSARTDPKTTRSSSAGDQHSSTSGARSSSRPSKAQSDPKTTGSSSARTDPKTTRSSSAGDQHSSTSGARSSSRPSSAQSDPKTAGSSSSARSDPKTTWSSSSRSDPKTTWSSSTRWNPDKSSSKAKVACPKCSRNCKSLDCGDLIIRCSYCNLFAVRGRQDSSIFLSMDEHGPGILGL